MQVRSITFGLKLNEMDARGYPEPKGRHFQKFLRELDGASAESNPGWRYEYLKPNEKRKMKANKHSGRRSVNKVKGLLDLIDLKRDIKMD
jgi:hypothetical protein